MSEVNGLRKTLRWRIGTHQRRASIADSIERWTGRPAPLPVALLELRSQEASPFVAKRGCLSATKRAQPPI